MDKLFFTIIFSLLIQYSFTQVLENITYLKINSSVYKDVKSIKIISSTKDCYLKDSLPCFSVLTFDKGKLIKELIYDGDYNHSNASEDCGYSFIWSKEKIKYRNGAGYISTCSARQKEALEYKYKANKIDRTIYSSYLINNGKNGASIEIVDSLITNFKYDLSGNLISEISDENKKFYIYNDSMLVGYYPPEIKENTLLQNNDTLYYKKFIDTVSLIGFNNFKNRFLTTSTFRNLIDECYTPILSSNLLINDIPIKKFINKNGFTVSRYLIIEVLENYFLFYKFID
jgi:hypothetical protein